MEYGIVSIFGAGVLTFLTPCVLPLVPVYLAVLANGPTTNAPRGQLILRALIFALGFTLVFAVMGLGASTIGSALREYSGWVQLVGAALVLVFALKFLGFINIPALDRIVKADDRKYQTRLSSLNALVMGIVFAAGWSPCVGPVLGSVLTYTATTSSNPWTGAGYLSIYGAGFALPLLLTAAFAEAALGFLARLNPHLPRIERVIGALMLAVAGYLAMNAYEKFGPQVTEESRASTLATLLDEVDNSAHPLPVMVEFYTPDCTICKEMQPLLTKITDQCDRNGVRVKTIDVSAPENRHLTRELSLIGVPTFIFIDEFASEAARLVGKQTESTLKQGLSALRGESCPGMTLLPKQEDGENIHPKLAFPTQNIEESPIACDSANASKKNNPRERPQETGQQSWSDISVLLNKQEGCLDSEGTSVSINPSSSPKHL